MKLPGIMHKKANRLGCKGITETKEHKMPEPKKSTNSHKSRVHNNVHAVYVVQCIFYDLLVGLML